VKVQKTVRSLVTITLDHEEAMRLFEDLGDLYANEAFNGEKNPMLCDLLTHWEKLLTQMPLSRSTCL